MSSSHTLERERSRALPSGLAAIAAVALFITSVIVRAGGTDAAVSTEAQALASFDSDTELTAALLQAAAFALLVLPITHLFRAAALRSSEMKTSLIGIVIAGPLFLAVGSFLVWLGVDNAADAFNAPGGGSGIPVGEYAEDLLQDDTALQAAQGLAFGGALGTGIGLFYASRHALRTGLLPRFLGSLGIATGLVIALFALSGPGIYSVLLTGFVALFFYIFLVSLGFLLAGWWPGGRPPAWEAGRAIPPSRPGEAPEVEDSDRPADPDEFARPAEGAGTGTEASDAPRKRKRRG